MFKKIAVAALAVAAFASIANAATQTSNITVSANVQADCSTVTSPFASGDLNWGTIGGTTVQLDTTASVTLNCTPGTAYTVTAVVLTGGTGGTTNFQMANGANNIDYQLFLGPTELSGSTPGTFSATGNGIQNITLFGRIPAQAAKPAGAYTGTVQLTLTY